MNLTYKIPQDLKDTRMKDELGAARATWARTNVMIKTTSKVTSFLTFIFYKLNIPIYLVTHFSQYTKRPTYLRVMADREPV